jgi:hypothetical protein
LPRSIIPIPTKERKIFSKKSTKLIRYFQIPPSREIMTSKGGSKVVLPRPVHRMANTLVIIIRKHIAINRMQLIRIIGGISLSKDGKIETLGINSCMISIVPSKQRRTEILIRQKKRGFNVSLDRG